jgi:hypothetical protein
MAHMRIEVMVAARTSPFYFIFHVYEGGIESPGLLIVGHTT